LRSGGRLRGGAPRGRRPQKKTWSRSRSMVCENTVEAKFEGPFIWRRNPEQIVLCPSDNMVHNAPAPPNLMRAVRGPGPVEKTKAALPGPWAVLGKNGRAGGGV